MTLPAHLAAELADGVAYSFGTWPNPVVPAFGAGVYTIWHTDGRFIYVGMSGRGITADTVRRNTPQGLYTRLQSHASGRRSGDQCCVYVADRLVLPSLSPEDIGQATTKWMLLCVGTSTKTSTIALFWCLTDRRHPRLKRRSSAVSGRWLSATQSRRLR